MEQKNKYDLTEKEFEQCLMQVKMAMFLGRKADKNPISYWIIAQPGAGKTALTKFVINQNHEKLDKNGFVQIDADVVGLYHKYHDEIVKEFPEDAYSLLQKFTQPVLDEHIRPIAVDNKFNLVQEGTFTSPLFMDILDYQKKAGYYIDLNVLAVNRYESLLSCYEREQNLREDNLKARVVVPDRHDYSYNKMLETIENGNRLGYFDVTNVYKRGKIIDLKNGEKSFENPQKIYMSTRNKNIDNVTAIKQEREKDLEETLEHPEKYLTRIENLKSRIKKYGVKEPLNRLEKLEKEFLNEVEKYNKKDELNRDD